MQNRTVWITGSSRGIGKATALYFARQGDRVVLHCHTHRQQAEELLCALTGSGAQAMLVQADVADPAQVTAAHQQIVAQFGPVEVLVNNAGIAQQALFTELSPEEWHRMFAVHVDGCFHCCQAVLPGMIRQQRGAIINLSSMWGQIGGSCEVHYSAAKAAVIGLTKALAKEVGLSGVTVNCVAPGVIETDMNGALDEPSLEMLRDAIPLGRIGTPAEVAKAVYFLASDSASYLTGQVISPNGGFVV